MKTAYEILDRLSRFSPEVRQDLREKENLRQIGSILTGDQIPNFAYEEQAPQEIQKSKMRQLFALGTPEAFKAAQSLNTPASLFEGSGFSAQIANKRYMQYLQAGVPPQEAETRAINDALSTQSTIVTTPDGTYSIPKNGLPPIGGAGPQRPIQQPNPTTNTIDSTRISGRSQDEEKPNIVLPNPVKDPFGGYKIGPGKKLTETEKNDLRGERDELVSSIQATDELIQKLEDSPSLGGALGHVRHIAESAIGISSQLPGLGMVPQVASKIPGLEGLTEAKQSVSGTEPLLGRIATGLARSRYGSGRLPVDYVKEARKSIQTRGAFGTKQATDALKQVRGELSNSLQMLESRAKEAEFNLNAPDVGKGPDSIEDMRTIGTKTYIKIKGKWMEKP